MIGKRLYLKNLVNFFGNFFWVLSLNMTPGCGQQIAVIAAQVRNQNLAQGIRGDSENQRGKKSQRKSGARTLGNPAEIGRDLLVASIKGE